jgi:hypothetical protein
MVTGRTQAFQQFCRVFGDLSRAPELDPLPLGIVHQENKRLGVLGQVADRDVLTVSGAVGEGKGSLGRDFQEALSALNATSAKVSA